MLPDKCKLRLSRYENSEVHQVKSNGSECWATAKEIKQEIPKLASCLMSVTLDLQHQIIVLSEVSYLELKAALPWSCRVIPNLSTPSYKHEILATPWSCCLFQGDLTQNESTYLESTAPFNWKSNETYIYIACIRLAPHRRAFDSNSSHSRIFWTDPDFALSYIASIVSTTCRDT